MINEIRFNFVYRLLFVPSLLQFERKRPFIQFVDRVVEHSNHFHALLA